MAIYIFYVFFVGHSALVVLRWGSGDTLRQCLRVPVTTSSVKNLEKCIPFDENGGVLFWALDLEKKPYNYISLFLTVKTVTILTLPLS